MHLTYKINMGNKAQIIIPSPETQIHINVSMVLRYIGLYSVFLFFSSIIFSVVYAINMSHYTFKVYHTYPKNTIYTTLSLVFSSILLQVHFISAIVFPPLIVTVGC